jgi:hypothetical protein
MSTILVGTSSWTDKTLIESRKFYPAGATTPEERLRYYASQFPILEFAATADLESAVAEVVRRRAQALFVQNDELFFDNRVEIARAALRHALPTLVQGKESLEAGGLISYTFSVAEL